MTDHELDHVYTTLCKTMTGIGETDAPLFLARLAMLCLTKLDDATAALALIGDAARFDSGAPASPGGRAEAAHAAP